MSLRLLQAKAGLDLLSFFNVSREFLEYLSRQRRVGRINF